MRIFTDEEVKEAVWDCEDPRARAQMVLTSFFYKTCWDILKINLMQVLHEFHANGRLVKGCNSSFIILLPKKEDVRCQPSSSYLAHR